MSTLASSRPALDRLAALLDGKQTGRRPAINQDLRWTIIARLNRFDYPGAAALVRPSRRATSRTAARPRRWSTVVSRPDPAVKSEWLGTIQDTKTKLPFSKVRTAMGSLYPTEQNALAEQTADQRLATPAASWTRAPARSTCAPTARA
jgi:aminopeptidase N